MATGLGYSLLKKPAPPEFESDTPYAYALGAVAGATLGGLAMQAYVVAWDIYKRIAFLVGAPEMIPGGGESSRPTLEQFQWGNRGITDAIRFDAGFAGHFRPRFALDDLPDESLICNEFPNF